MKLLMSTQFKKDLKRYQNKPRKIAALKVVLKSLKYSKIHIMPLSSRKALALRDFCSPHCCRVFTLCKTALHKLEMDYIKNTEPRSF